MPFGFTRISGFATRYPATELAKVENGDCEEACNANAECDHFVAHGTAQGRTCYLKSGLFGPGRNNQVKSWRRDDGVDLFVHHGRCLENEACSASWFNMPTPLIPVMNKILECHMGTSRTMECPDGCNQEKERPTGFPVCRPSDAILRDHADAICSSDIQGQDLRPLFDHLKNLTLDDGLGLLCPQ